MALGWIGAIMVRLGRQGVERLMLALDGRALWAVGAAQACPEAHEAEERSIIAQETGTPRRSHMKRPNPARRDGVSP